MPDGTPAAPDVLDLVRARYARGARERVPELCCPVDYDSDRLRVLPEEILERDYGCGDPSRFAREGDVVLDLGSGAGKVCYLASERVGPRGRVIGVDATPEMLELARRHRDAIGDRIGWRNVEFRRGRIQDLALDLDRLDAWLARNQVRTVDDAARLRAEEERLRREEPMVPDGSVDLVVSNCVLNLVDGRDKQALFREIHRVLRRGGRTAISDIVSDEDVPEELQRDPELWTGCISGALREDRFLRALADAGLYGVEIESWQEEPWAVVEGIEFRSVTVVAHKGKEGPCMEHLEAVVYRGPWREVQDDDGHVLRRGERTAVCRKTYEILTREPYASHVVPVPPLAAVAPEEAQPFACDGTRRRDPLETKRGVAREDALPESCCEPGEACC